MNIKPQLYILASGLFNQPTPTCIANLQGLLDELLQTIPENSSWQTIFKVLKPQLNYNQDLEIEYNRLFVLSFPHSTIQPFASYWLESDQGLMGNSTLEIKNMMAEHGIKVAENAGLLPDHIVSELEFIAYLASQNDEKSLQTKQQLLGQHCAYWMPQFIEALQAINPTLYYQLAANFLKQLIEFDLKEYQL
ncbi:MAG: molecular chaperone TorD family protein [Candidatus Marithrix sp.]|nr:molecular chaperone TorD family protein [Candidatus Marithrix sp.]